MAEKQQEPVVVVLQQDTPTTKQQLTSAAIQIGSALAVPVVLAAGFATAGAVGRVKQKVAARRASKLATVTELPTEK